MLHAPCLTTINIFPEFCHSLASALTVVLTCHLITENKKLSAMKFFQLDFTTVILRFYLMMAVVIVALFTGYPVLASLALPIFLSAMMGIQFTPRLSAKKQESKASNAHVQHQAAH